jgi:hypothetical protein
VGSTPRSGWGGSGGSLSGPQAWWLGFRRLQVRYERRQDMLLGFVDLAAAIVCLRILHSDKF